MIINSEKFVLDACAIIAFLKKEDGTKIVKDIFKSKSEIFLHAVTLLEVYYDLLREIGEIGANSFIDYIKQTNIKIIYLINEETIKAAGYFKANYKISLGDTFVLAAAKLNSATIVTSDRHEFEIVEKNEKNLEFLWIR
jgi:PIN domain nuclease of toxin-antitoxin system